MRNLILRVSKEDSPMGRNRRSFTIGFKEQVVAEVKGGQISINGAGRKYEVSYSTIERWIARFDAGKLTGKQDIDEMALRAENERLKAKVGELTMENDLLKKFQSWRQQRRSADTCVITEKNLAQFVGGAKCSK